MPRRFDVEYWPGEHTTVELPDPPPGSDPDDQITEALTKAITESGGPRHYECTPKGARFVIWVKERVQK